MQLYLVRHANAGQRLLDGRDIHRPLSPEGWERAEALVDLFAAVEVDLLVSSPAARCVQTLEPLALARGLPVVECQALWEGSSVLHTMRELESLPGRQVVACSHGDVIPAVIETLGGGGVPVVGRGCELGSVWALARDPGRPRWTGARYVAPRATALA